MSENAGDERGVLDGVRVLDLSIDYAGALVAMNLADQGAQVIRLGSEGALERTFAHRGKVRITSAKDLDALFDTLVDRADVVIEDAPTSRLRARDRVGAPDSGQVHCWVPAFPEDHPEASQRGFEGIAQAHMGVYEVPLGRKPVYHSFSVLSVTAAAYATCGVVAALIARQRDGRGQRVEVSRAMTAYAVLELNAMFTVGAPKSWATLQWASTPFIDGYPAADGEWIYIHAGLAAHLPRLLDVLEREAPRQVRSLRSRLSDSTMRDPTSVPGVREVRAIRALLGEIFAIRPAIVWEGRLSKAGLCATVARQPEAWREHEHARASEQVVERDGKLMPGANVRVGEVGSSARATQTMSGEEALARWPVRAEKALTGERDDTPPLHGLRVLDMTQVIAGPTAARTLAELGASVHRVENPHFTAPWVEPFHIAYNAGKTSETINLKATRGQRALSELLDSFSPDVLVQNYRPGAPLKLDLDEETLRARFPSLVYAHLTAYGTRGPWGDRPGWEQTAQAACGMQRAWGGAGAPSLFPLPLNDLCTGVHGALGVLLAIYARNEDGRGRRVEAALTSSATLMQARTLFDREPGARGSSELGAAPTRRFYMARDGWFFLAAESLEALWSIPGLERSRGSSGEALVLALETEFRRAPLATWRARVARANLTDRVAMTSRRTQRGVLTDRDAAKRGFVERREHRGVGEVTETKSPLRLDRCEAVELATAPPTEREPERQSAAGWLARQLAGAAAIATKQKR